MYSTVFITQNLFSIIINGAASAIIHWMYYAEPFSRYYSHSRGDLM